MQVNRFHHPSRFLERANRFLMRAEAENNVMLGITSTTRSFGEDAYLATVEDGDSVLACALRTPPYDALVSRVAPGAVEYLVSDLAARYPDLPEVLGPEPDVTAFAELWGRRTGTAPSQGRRQRLFEIRQALQLPRSPAGRLRIAEEQDLPTAVAWCAEFIAEALPGDSTNPEVHAASRIAARSLFLWDDGGPVSMAGWAGRTLRGVRVNFVYTPPARRGRGYATACVARLTQTLLDEGRAFCCLYADLSNTTANTIYQKIGYSPISEWSSYALNSPNAGSIR